MRKCLPVHTILGLLCDGLPTLNSFSASPCAGEAKPIVLGLCTGDADRYNVELQRYDRMIPVYRENGIRAALVESSFFY